MRSYNNQKGSILVLMAITIPFLFALSALAVDLSYLYAQRAHMQNIADAAALAGASQLGLSNDASKEMAQTYVARNSNASDASSNVSYTCLIENGIKKIRVDITKNAPLVFMKYFKFNTAPLTVYAIASYSGGGPGLFDYTAISGASNGILKFGGGGSNKYNGLFHSNYRFHPGGGSNTLQSGAITAVDAKIWDIAVTPSYFPINGTATGGVAPIDISLENSGLKSLIDQIKKQNVYAGNYTTGVDFSSFGTGIYVTGSFMPGWIKYEGNLDTTTIVIAEGNITIPSNNGKTISENNHIILCSLTGDIKFTFNGPFYGILYAPQGSITLDMGNSTFNGSIVGNTLMLGAGATNINGKSFPGVGGGGAPKIRLIE